MLPKHSRLTKQQIEKHLIKARRLKTSRFLVLYTRIPQLREPQISFTVSKKVAPKAVLRNKLRRRGYDAVKSLIPSLSLGVLALISYTKADTTASIQELREEVLEAFKSAKLLQ